MNVLVTGASGFVGSHLIPSLVNAGHHVFASARNPENLARFAGVEPAVANLSEDLPAALPERMEAIVHLAQANVPFPDHAGELFAVNVASTQRLLDYARRAGVGRFVLASSGSVYGGGERPWREDDPLEGSGFYTATKIAAEWLTRAYGEEFGVTVLRLFTPYGPGQSGRLVPGLINRVRTGQAVTLREGGRPRSNPLFIRHVVDVFRQALDSQGHHVLNVGGSEILSIRDMAEIIGREVGKAPVFQDVPGPSGGDVVGDISRLRQLYWLPENLTPFADGVRAMVAEMGAGSGL